MVLNRDQHAAVFKLADRHAIELGVQSRMEPVVANTGELGLHLFTSKHGTAALLVVFDAHVVADEHLAVERRLWVNDDIDFLSLIHI